MHLDILAMLKKYAVFSERRRNTASQGWFLLLFGTRKQPPEFQAQSPYEPKVFRLGATLSVSEFRRTPA